MIRRLLYIWAARQRNSAEIDRLRAENRLLKRQVETLRATLVGRCMECLTQKDKAKLPIS